MNDIDLLVLKPQLDLIFSPFQIISNLELPPIAHKQFCTATFGRKN